MLKVDSINGRCQGLTRIVSVGKQEPNCGWTDALARGIYSVRLVLTEEVRWYVLRPVSPGAG